MLNFLRRIFFGVSTGIAGLSFVLIKILGLGIHIYTIYFAYVIKGFGAAIISFFLPVLSQIYWVFISVKIFSAWMNPYAFYVGLYLILTVVLWIVVVIFGASAAASYKDD